MADLLPDTPPWSPWRRGAAIGVMLVGALMVLAGRDPAMNEPRAALFIELGAYLLWGGALLLVGGASLERCGAWFSLRGRAGGL